MSDQSLIKIKQEVARNAFNSNNNCAQSVLRATALDLSFELEQALQLASGFGGGMGKLQNTCGAVTGAFMSIGFHQSKYILDPEERKNNTTILIQEFAKRFKTIHGVIDCKSLLNCDLNTEEGKSKFENEKLGEKVCEKCISSSIEILDDILFHSERRREASESD